MEIEKLIEQLNDWNENLISELCADDKLTCDDLCDGKDCIVVRAATALSTLQAETEKLRASVDNWKNKYVETNSKWISAENKWARLDKAVRNGNIYRPMQEELNLTHEENQSLKDADEKLRAELEQVKRALAMMWFSCVNSDKEMPHSYETEALEEAERILGPWTECMPKYLKRGPKEG
jgi:chromosome segregation ATPase